MSQVIFDNILGKLREKDVSSGGGGGGTNPLFPTSGTGTATGAVIGDLATKSFHMVNGGTSIFSYGVWDLGELNFFEVDTNGSGYIKPIAAEIGFRGTSNNMLLLGSSSQLGDALGNVNGTVIMVADTAQTITLTAGGVNSIIVDGASIINTYQNDTHSFIGHLRQVAQFAESAGVITAAIGDTNGDINGTRVVVDDSQRVLNLKGLHTNIVEIQAFSNNAAAVTGGLNVGDLYYTSSGGDGLVKVVI